MTINALLLTCANEEEAEKISKILFDKRLVACIKKMQVTSSFLYKGQQNTAKEVLLIMESAEELFTEVEAEIKKLHSYKTFVLLALPVTRASHGVEDWIEEELTSH